MLPLCHFPGAQAKLPIVENPVFMGAPGDLGDRLDDLDPPPLHQHIQASEGNLWGLASSSCL